MPLAKQAEEGKGFNHTKPPARPELHALFGNISTLGPKFLSFVQTLPKSGVVAPLHSGQDDPKMREILQMEGMDPDENVILATERGWDILLVAEHHKS